MGALTDAELESWRDKMRHMAKGCGAYGTILSERDALEIIADSVKWSPVTGYDAPANAAELLVNAVGYARTALGIDHFVMAERRTPELAAEIDAHGCEICRAVVARSSQAHNPSTHVGD